MYLQSITEKLFVFKKRNFKISMKNTQQNQCFFKITNILKKENNKWQKLDYSTVLKKSKIKMKTMLFSCLKRLLRLGNWELTKSDYLNFVIIILL